MSPRPQPLQPTATPGPGPDPGPGRGRIALFGNTCNNFFRLGRALRQFTDFDVHLFIETTANTQLLPESDEPALAGNYPDWIHRGPYLRPASFLLPSTSPLVRELARFDLALVSHFGPMFAPFTATPLVFVTAGADLTVHPLAHKHLFSYYPTWFDRIAGLVACYWQRRGIRACREIWTVREKPFLAAIAALRLPPSQVSTTAVPRLIIDTDRFRFTEAVWAEGRATLHQNGCEPDDLVVFHPTRLMMNDHPRMRESGNWKQNDSLIRAVHLFRERQPEHPIKLVLLDRSASPDIPLARQLIAELGIGPQVVWLKAPRPVGFTRDELIPLYAACDVVAADFGIPWFGSVAIEGLSLSKPVLNYVDEDALRARYAWHPLLSATTPEGLYAFLDRLACDPAYRAERGALGRQWIEEYHSPASVKHSYAVWLQALLAQTQATRHGR